MRRFLSLLMALVMLMPGLACANMMHTQEPAAAHMHMAKDMPCCPKHKPSPDSATMLMKDCMKVDLQQASDAPLLKKVDLVKYAPFFIPPVTFQQNIGISEAKRARDPPERRSVSLKSPVYLSTLRLRI